MNPSIEIAPRYKFQPNSKLIKFLQKLNLDRKQNKNKQKNLWSQVGEVMKLQVYKENLFLEIETSFFRDPGYRLSRNFSFKQKYFITK